MYKTVKEISEDTGVSIQGIYQKMKRDRYKDDLKGHVTRKDGVMYLDEKAIEIMDLNRKINSSVTAVDMQIRKENQELKNLIQQFQEREEKYKSELLQIQKKFIDMQEIEKKNLLLIKDNKELEHKIAMLTKDLDYNAQLQSLKEKELAQDFAYKLENIEKEKDRIEKERERIEKEKDTAVEKLYQYENRTFIERLKAVFSNK